MKFRLILLIFCFPVFAASAAEPVVFAPEQLDFFEKKVRPVLTEQCTKCHSAQGEKIKGGLTIDSRAALLKGGDTGAAVVPGEPEKSLLIHAIEWGDEDLQMPPKHRLDAAQVADFVAWVKMGAPDPRDGALPVAKQYNWDEAKRFWSFQPVKKPAVPEVKKAEWARNEIDRFVLAKLDEHGLTPNADADKRTLLRRVTYDLTGLPPTPDEMRAFLEDASPGAFEKVVDRLLASPQYGAQWGRHWLDVVRYADTSGCNSDFPVPSAYRYRNYVIDAFNRDEPYDQFLREQIAGDLLSAASEQEHFDKIVATGYLAIARRFGSQANEFHLTIEDVLDNLGKATLGLSIGCARCHDHKFDPIPTKDYYALYGIFESTTFAFPGTEVLRHTKDFVPLVGGAEGENLAAEGRELGQIDRRLRDLKDEKKRLARTDKSAEAKASEPLPALNPEANEPVKGRTVADAQREIEAAGARQAELEKHIGSFPKAYAVSEGKPADTAIQKKGDPASKGDIAPRGFLQILGGQGLPPEEKGSGRKELADWISAPSNPLTARVMVNRIWQQHFGKGLVKTPNDFGIRGERPTHPELLDWLANRFVESGWSMKTMHRLILMSRAYQMSCNDNPTSAAKDVANDFLWHFNSRRLSAEELRDSILAVTDSLDPTPGGLHPFPPESDFHYTQHRPFIENYQTTKRSVFMMQQRIRKQPFLEVFDGADTNASSAVRPISYTPIQALWMMNNSFAHEQAAKLADRIYAARTEEPERIEYAYELALGRPASADEIVQAQRYIGDVGTALAETKLPPDQQPRAALASFTRVLLSSNEFLFLE